MTEVLPGLLWLGHAGDGRDAGAIRDADLGAVVQLAAEEPPLALPRDLVTLRFPLTDGAGNPPALIRLAVRAVSGLLGEGVRTLVCCGAGRSRAPAVAAAAWARAEGVEPDDALARLARVRPVDVAPGLWADVRDALAPGRSGGPAGAALAGGEVDHGQ